MMARSSFSLPCNILADPALRAGIRWGLFSSVAEAAGYGLLVVAVQWMAAGRDNILFGSVILAALLVTLSVQSACRAVGLVNDFTGTYRVMARLRLYVADHLLELPVRRQIPDQRSAMIDLMTGRFSAVQEIFTHLWGVVIPGMALPILLLVMIARLWGMAALILFLTLPVMAGSMAFAFLLLDRADAALATAREIFTGAVLTVFEGADEIRFFDPAGQIFARAQNAAETLRNRQMALELAPSPAILGHALACQAGMAAAIWSVIHAFQKDHLSAGYAFAAILLIHRFCRCMMDLAGQIAALRFARNIVQRIRQIMALPPMPSPSHSVPLKGLELRLADMSVSFGDNIPEKDGREPEGLSGIDASLLPGRHVVLVGVSGSGKTTFASLLPRLHDVEAGAITIGGADLRHLARPHLTELVSIVPQDIHLFEGTIADNIRLGRPDASDAEVLIAARKANAEDFIRKLPAGLNTEIHAAGTILSGGEKQRLAIARALLMQSPVLILDEATSQLDTHSETVIRDVLTRTGSDRTVLTIAHRLWIARDADEVWVIDKGRLVERGPHTDLLRAGGIYARLWHAQQAPRSWAAPAPIRRNP